MFNKLFVLQKSTAMVETLQNLSIDIVCATVVEPLEDVPVAVFLGGRMVKPGIPYALADAILRRLKTMWVYECILPSEELLSFEFRHLDLETLSRESFIALMNHPLDMIPDFYFYPLSLTSCHVLFDYYILTMDHRPVDETRLCHDCFLQMSSPPQAGGGSSFTHEEYWQEKGYNLNHVERHIEVETEDIVRKVVKRRRSWCDRCILMPLFKLQDLWTCEVTTGYHEGRKSDDELVPVYSYKRRRLNYP